MAQTKNSLLRGTHTESKTYSGGYWDDKTLSYSCGGTHDLYVNACIAPQRHTIVKPWDRPCVTIVLKFIDAPDILVEAE